MQLNYVLCPSYHGATLLAVLLANHSRIASLGDAIPTRDYVQRCSCGDPVNLCAFWTELIERLHPKGGQAQGALAEQLDTAFPLFKATRADQVITLAGLALGNWVWSLKRGRMGFADRYLRFWAEVLRMQGADQFVDGEKSVTKVALLKSLFGRMADVRVIHLVRDPRGFLHSCRKHMEGVTLEQVAVMWNHHANIAKLARPVFKCRYRLQRYEDLCTDPTGTMAGIFKFLGVLNEDVVRKPGNLEKYHMMGNKMLSVFDGTVRLDDSWKKSVSERDQKRIVEFTAPLSQKYGYR